MTTSPRHITWFSGHDTHLELFLRLKRVGQNLLRIPQIFVAVLQVNIYEKCFSFHNSKSILRSAILRSRKPCPHHFQIPSRLYAQKFSKIKNQGKETISISLLLKTFLEHIYRFCIILVSLSFSQDECLQRRSAFAHQVSACRKAFRYIYKRPKT